MKNNAKKIEKLLEKFDRIFTEYIEKAQREPEKEEKKREKTARKAENICRRALALCREDIANGLPDDGKLLVGCVFRLSDYLIRRGNRDEAEGLLSEIYEGRKAYAGCFLLTGCMGNYGSILCESGVYDKAAGVLNEFLTRVNTETAQDIYPDGLVPDDGYAVCRGLGNAAYAFTYARGGEGFSPERFTLPVGLLEKMGKHGIDAGNDNICKAAYYAASQQLFLTCYEPVPGADVSRAAEYVAKCVDACDKSRNDDLYYLAALRLTALIAARDCRFADAAELCRMTLDRCSEYKGETIRRNFGSLHSIAGDMNLLLGVLHYRASKLRDCIRYFEDAFTSFQEDSLGKAMWCVGYAEAETEILFMSAAEKCALAEKYIGLARFSQKDAYPLDQCVGIMDAGVNLLETVGWNDPFFLISASSDYNILSQMCERGGDKEQAAKFDELSKSRGVEALTNLERIVSDGEKKQKYFEKIQSFRRIALRLGLLELYGDYTRFEILMSQPPFSDMDHIHLARLNFDMGEYSRVVGRNESAVDYFNEVRRHSFDSEGNPFYRMSEGNIYEFSLIASASCLVKCGKMAKAIRTFREFADMHNEDCIDGKTMKIRIAGLSREVGLDPVECAGYMHEAAAAAESDDSSFSVAAELYNQEGICWYNASPLGMSAGTEENDPDGKIRLEEKYDENELQAFENALRVLRLGDGSSDKTMELLPSLHSNIGECYMRREDYIMALAHYDNAIAAFESFFESGSFTGRKKTEQEPYLFQYGLCFKALGDIYNELDDNEKCADALTKAIEVMEKIDDTVARNELAACLNARGVVYFRLGNYKKNIEDATRAIALKKDDDGGEINMAIMLKNRSDAYRELGDFKSMQSDLSESINMLDKSKLPDELLGSFYGSHWFSMGVCQEGLHRIGKAADAYRRAAGYMDKSIGDGDQDAYMKALCHFRRAVCLCRREEQEYYGALYEYSKAINLLEKMPASNEKNENLRQLLSSRGSLYEAFREIDLAKADFSRAESLRSAKESS